jgi:hypothetical protein
MITDASGEIADAIALQNSGVEGEERRADDPARVTRHRALDGNRPV